MGYQNFLNLSSNMWGIGGVLFAILIIWSFVWKGLALWRAARKCHLAWFIILLIVNTLGILEIIYYFFVAKDDKAVDCRK